MKYVCDYVTRSKLIILLGNAHANENIKEYEQKIYKSTVYLPTLEIGSAYFTPRFYLLWGSLQCIIWRAGERAGEQVTDNYCALVISNGFHLTQAQQVGSGNIQPNSQ